MYQLQRLSLLQRGLLVVGECPRKWREAEQCAREPGLASAPPCPTSPRPGTMPWADRRGKRLEAGGSLADLEADSLRLGPDEEWLEVVEAAGMRPQLEMELG